ncbi:hypothetical protein E8E15_009330 [Penicillium rubens]|uniref:uncharacterized protein n=1 Tax=Penicillium rubens TaxID=1108849 RepID=UPI001DD562CD|nr:uncharacterized protein N7525_010601 [Penicillium rubens]KAF3021382.1 hypothetical protein E8E15_009330 [Penicillium rubens]KAJ5036284.1 hypothetical protein NUH16_004156 [Penicillium rubens]KAJ5821317.1 hypothetical protein N7525_010601 [Penicillium rubens]KAJ5858963.1 hypothetical protein N7534_004240 [Penicillium rubens]
MSELLGSQDSKPVSDCHPSPKYHLCEPSPDVLTSIIENQRAFRLATKRMTEIEIISEDFCENHPAHDSDIQIKIDRLEKLSPLLEELMHLCTKLTNLLKERLENPEIHIAIGKLSDSELNRAYASLKQNPNRQMRRELAQNSQDRDDCFCSSGRLLESSKVDNMNDKLGQSPPSYDMAASVRKASDSATSKPARRFWKKFWRCLARL